MIDLNEILQRDHRTTLPLRRISSESLNCMDFLSCENTDKLTDNCDKCNNKSQKMKHSKSLYLMSKKLLSYYLVFTISFYIMTSKQAEANPVPATVSMGRDEVDKINFLNLHCDISSGHIMSSTLLSDSALRGRLIAVLVSCHSAYQKTKTLTDTYIKQLWGKDETVETHHNTWKHKNIPWLWPENDPIPKSFRGEIHKLHFDELKRTHWTREKIFEYLGKIYQRFQRIGVGVQIVNKWNDLASMDGTTLLNPGQVNISTKLFKNATEGIHEVLCQIQGIFLDMAIDPRTDLDITPFVLDQFIKLNHWLVYREYEDLMDYSHKLLRIMTEDKMSGK